MCIFFFLGGGEGGMKLTIILSIFAIFYFFICSKIQKFLFYYLGNSVQ